MPFYGWTKHIIKYVLTYPTDHPYRTQFLSVLATQNSDGFSSGLDQRMQLLFFLGSPGRRRQRDRHRRAAAQPLPGRGQLRHLGRLVLCHEPADHRRR